ncbi:MAG: hypothetical protein WBQ17_08115 [Rhizomicrobium sp.]
MNLKAVGIGAGVLLFSAAMAAADVAPDTSAIQNGIYQQMSAGAHGISITVRHLHLKGPNVVGDAVVHWEENIFGNRVVLIDGDYPFHTASSEVLFAQRVKLGFGTSIKIHLDAAYQPVRNACIDLHAEFLGGHILEQRCLTVP